MRTCSNFYPSNSTTNIPRRSNRRRIPNLVEPEIRTIAEIIPMADRTMEELLQAPTEGDNIFKADDRIDKLADQISNLVEVVNKRVIAPAKVVEKTCVTCGWAYAYYKCIATDSNPSSVCAISNLVEIVNKQVIAPTKAVEKTCVTCGGAHAYYKCIATDSNPSSVCANQPSTLGTLPTNTIPNPKGEMKAVTTRSGLAYEGPSIPTESLLEKVDEQNTKEILDKEHSNSSGSIAQLQPSVVPILISELDVPRTQSKPTIPYPSRLNDQKLREKATSQMEKLFQIFHDLHFDISFADALLLMPKFASTIKCLLANKDKHFKLVKVSLNENCSAMLLKKHPEKLGDPELTPTRMTLELADRSITRPKGVAEDVFVKVGKFPFPTDFIVVDFEADLRVPLILGMSFLRTGRALIDVYGEDITLRVNDESITFNLNQTIRYSLNCDDTSVNRVDVIDVVCEDFVQDVLDFWYNPKSSSLTLVSDDLISESDACKVPIVKTSSPTLTLFGESDFFLEEIEDFLNDDSIPIGIENSVFDPKGDILLIKKLLNEDPFQLPPMDLKAIAWKISDIKGIDPRFCTHKILMEDDYKPAVQSQRRVNLKIHDVIKKESGIEVDKAKVDVIAKIPHPTTVKGVRSFLGDVGFYRHFIQDFSKIARPMTHLLEKETLFVFSKECINAFNTLKKKLTEAPILVVSDWKLPFELMCDASDYAIEHRAYWALKHVNFDLKTAGDHRKLQLNELSELRDQAYENFVIYKERTKKIHDSKIKNRIFNVGDQVLLFNSCLEIFFGKLKTCWSGPFTITHVFPYGTIELSQPNSLNFKVNGHRVKHYFGGNIPSNVTLDLYTFPMDN
nr:hypothetical protein [Tanacetum cinerariifolium]